VKVHWTEGSFVHWFEGSLDWRYVCPNFHWSIWCENFIYTLSLPWFLVWVL